MAVGDQHRHVDDNVRAEQHRHGWADGRNIQRYGVCLCVRRQQLTADVLGGLDLDRSASGGTASGSDGAVREEAVVGRPTKVGPTVGPTVGLKIGLAWVVIAWLVPGLVFGYSGNLTPPDTITVTSLPYTMTESNTAYRVRG